jgi:hypothetical protein
MDLGYAATAIPKLAGKTLPKMGRSPMRVAADGMPDSSLIAFHNTPLRKLWRRALAAVERKEPPGAMVRYDGRLTTPSACLRILQVLTAFRFDLCGIHQSNASLIRAHNLKPFVTIASVPPTDIG